MERGQWPPTNVFYRHERMSEKNIVRDEKNQQQAMKSDQNTKDATRKQHREKITNQSLVYCSTFHTTRTQYLGLECPAVALSLNSILSSHGMVS